MSMSLLTGVVIVLCIVVTVIGGALYWLFRTNSRLELKCRALEEIVDRNSKDLAGICSAAIEVDDRLHHIHAQIHALNDKLYDIEMPQQTPVEGQSYQLAIQKIHQGAGAEDLVKDCGLTRDEADLLVRLHDARES